MTATTTQILYSDVYEFPETVAKEYRQNSTPNDESRGVLRFRFELGQNGKLKSIGDGSYGMVFAAVDADAGPDQRPQRFFAVKILYQSLDGSSSDSQRRIAQLDELRIRAAIANRTDSTIQAWSKRFENQESPLDEDQSMSRVNDVNERKALEELKKLSGDESAGRYLVLPIAGTTKLESFDDKLFGDDSVKFGGNAYVMKRYPVTLKHLAEGAHTPAGLFTSEEVQDLDRQPTSDTSGEEAHYPRLRVSSRLHRSLEALRVAIDLSKGLTILYAAGYRHQDIKPANIFCQPDREPPEYRLGDLGFLEPTPAAGGNTRIYTTEHQGMGSIHYRSPEQRDSQDEAECSIVWSSANQGQLRTSDPKFAETRIEEGDFCFFAKDTNRDRLLITGVRDSAAGHKVLEVSRPENAQKAHKGPDMDRTLVKFVKRSTPRTDLFGLGAVMFDIVSAGRSPERLYDRLVSFDRDVSLADELTALYGAWQQGGTPDPAVSSVYDALHPPSQVDDYLPESVASTIARLMTSYPSDSFYREAEFEQAEDSNWQAAWAWHRVTTELVAVRDQLESDMDPSQIKASYCLSQPSEGEPSTGADQPTPSRPASLGAVLTSVGESHTVAQRWIRCTAIVRSVIEMINDNHEGDKSSWSFVFPLSPELVRVGPIGKQLRFASKEKGLDEPQFVEMLENRDPFILRNRNLLDWITPSWWHDQIVPVKATFIDPHRCILAHQPMNNRQNRAMEGDYLIPINRVSGRRVVYRVRKNLTRSTGIPGAFRDCQVESLGEGAPLGSGGYFLVKVPRPVEYYAGVIANVIFSSLYGFRPGTSQGPESLPKNTFAPPIRLTELCERRPVRFPLPSGFKSGAARRGFRGIGKRDESAAAQEEFKDLNSYSFALMSWLQLGGFVDSSVALGDRRFSDEWDLVDSEIRKWVFAARSYWQETPDREPGLTSLRLPASRDTGLHERQMVPEATLWDEILDKHAKPRVG